MLFSGNVCWGVVLRKCNVGGGCGSRCWNFWWRKCLWSKVLSEWGAVVRGRRAHALRRLADITASAVAFRFSSFPTPLVARAMHLRVARAAPSFRARSFRHLVLVAGGRDVGLPSGWI
jgi:hypothetical protein